MEVTTEGCIETIEETRERTLTLIAPFSRDDLEAAHNDLMSPLVWDLAHIAAYEDLWLCHRYGGEDLLHPEWAAMYDAFETPRPIRGSLPLLNVEQALDYLQQVRNRSVELLERIGPGDGVLFELVVRHEQQHNETMLQAIALAQLQGLTTSDDQAMGVQTRSNSGLERVEIAGGECSIGAPDRGFAYDNERPCHWRHIDSFQIGRTPVTNKEYLSFVENGGYKDSRWWTPEGWAWLTQNRVEHPLGWRQDRSGWQRNKFGQWLSLVDSEPVMHVSWWEADAFARASGARLPTEAEWEKAASWDDSQGEALRFSPSPRGEGIQANLDQRHLGPTHVGKFEVDASPYGLLDTIGNVWEWTASDFEAYPGFKAHPYREYSEVFFGPSYKVLRGGSWATRPRVVSYTFRNWDLPERRQIFAGIRLAWDS